MDLTRRDLIKAGIACSLAASPSDAFAQWFSSSGKNEKEITQNDAPEKLWKWSKEVYYKVNLGRNVQCLTCPNQCILEPDARSRCQSHVNKDGKLYTLVYGNPCSTHVDPIEKKPLYHFLPSSGVLSIATTGCSFNCLNCQNWEISQVRPEDVSFMDMFPDAVVKTARENGCSGIAYTYSEPTTFYEYMLDTSRLARKANIKNIWVSNGYINEPPLLELCKTLDGANIDIKSFSEDIYSRLNGGRLKPVLRTLMLLKEKGVWFEITSLVVPTYSDNMEMIKRMCGWILENLGPDYPLHFSRFYPRYKLTHLPPTPVSFLEKARKAAMEMGIHYAYAGNIPQADSNHTYCPSCKKKIIERLGYIITENKIKDGKCSFCRQPIAGVWEQ